MYVVPLPVTVPTFVPPAVPPKVTLPVLNPVTASLKTTVKLIVDPFVGSAWPEACSTVTNGATVSSVTVLSVLVEATFALPAASVATPAATDAVTVPLPVIPVTATL